jgi:uncharacterized RDD family membrane protein YckC
MNTIQPNPYAPPKAEVGDADDGSSQVELAGRGERLGAAILDSIIGGVLVALALLIGMDWNAAAAGNWQAAFNPIGLGIAGIGFIVYVAITIYLVNKNGQTMAKKMLGIKVVRSDGSRASLGRIFWLRNVVNAIPGAIPYIGNVYSLVDSLFIFNDQRQCIHDKIADTIVVKA